MLSTKYKPFLTMLIARHCLLLSALFWGTDRDHKNSKISGNFPIFQCLKKLQRSREKQGYFLEELMCGWRRACLLGSHFWLAQRCLSFIWAASDGHPSGGPRLERHSLMQCERERRFAMCWDDFLARCGHPDICSLYIYWMPAMEAKLCEENMSLPSRNF